MKAASILAAAAVATLTLIAPGQAHAADLPFADPDASGYLGLCNKAGEPVDHGSVRDQPFVWSATASVGAPAPYDGEGRTATLFAFQPRRGLAPGEWGGDLLTASAHYDNPAYPKAQATDGDQPLKDYTDTFPPSWDGLVQLRLYLGAPEQPPYTQRYAATVIRVTGDSWSVVSGGNVPCDASNAVSIETDLLPAFPPPTGAPAPAAEAGSVTGAEAGAAGDGGSGAGASTDAATAGAGVLNDVDRGAGGASRGPWPLLGLLALAAAATGVALAVRARRGAPTVEPVADELPPDELPSDELPSDELPADELAGDESVADDRPIEPSTPQRTS